MKLEYYKNLRFVINFQLIILLGYIFLRLPIFTISVLGLWSNCALGHFQKIYFGADFPSDFLCAKTNPTFSFARSTLLWMIDTELNSCYSLTAGVKMHFLVKLQEAILRR